MLPGPQYEGAFAATDRLLDQAGGPFKSREKLTAELVAGPAAMHFDRLAAGVVRNRLWDVVPHHPDHQRAVRAALIRPMLHDVWPQLPDQPASIGERVAEEVRMGLDAKVDEIWRYYRYGGRRPFEGDGSMAAAERGGSGRAGAGSAAADVAGGLRFLDAQAPAGGAVALRPSLGMGARRSKAFSASQDRGRE